VADSSYVLLRLNRRLQTESTAPKLRRSPSTPILTSDPPFESFPKSISLVRTSLISVSGSDATRARRRRPRQDPLSGRG
ncbi:MAG: hypothetical protein MZV70_65720, partial [Desulfobacterales bacterium]|nr:hypothetical protein [Desulfobacterales bacterium]